MTGEPTYLELGVPDPARALAFYRSVLGWELDPAAGGEVLGPVSDSGGFGRWAECRDDQGVRFGLRQPTSPG